MVLFHSQTHITYANNATRLMTNNPSGFAFRSMGSTSYHNQFIGDPLTQARTFLQRHFGQRGSIERTLSLDNFLLALGVHFDKEDESAQQEQQQQLEEQVQQQQQEEVQQDVTQEDSKEDTQEEPQEPLEDIQEAAVAEEALQLEEQVPKSESEPELHTWHLEQLPEVLPQLATHTEWHMEQLLVSNCDWHLQNCKWRDVPSSEFQLSNW